MTDGACLDFVRRAVAHICRSAGWNCISQSAHDTLTDVLLLHVENVATIAQTCTRQSSRTMPTLDDVAFSFRHIGVSPSELFPQPDDVASDDIKTVWEKLPGTFLTHSIVKSKQAETSLDTVDRRLPENLKDFVSVDADVGNYRFQGAESRDVSGDGSDLEMRSAPVLEGNSSDVSSVGNVEMTSIIQDFVEVSDPWEWPSVVKALDLTDKVSASASKHTFLPSNKKSLKAGSTIEHSFTIESSAIFPSEHIKLGERNNNDKTAVSTVTQTTNDQMANFSDRDQQNQGAVAQRDHHKIRSRFGDDVQAQEESVVGSKAGHFKIPKLKLKVGSHGDYPSDPGQTFDSAVDLESKHQKIKKKKRKAKDIDKDSRKSGLSKMPKKAKHKDKAMLPLQAEKSAANSTVTALAHHMETSSSVPSQATVVSQTLSLEQQAQLAAVQSEYHCPVCRLSDIDGVPWITCDRCNNDVWYHLFCVGLAHEPLVDEKWFCPKCQKKINKQARQQSKYQSYM